MKTSKFKAISFTKLDPSWVEVVFFQDFRRGHPLPLMNKWGEKLNQFELAHWLRLGCDQLTVKQSEILAQNILK